VKVLPKLACSRLKHDSFSIKLLTFLDEIAAYLSLIIIVTLEHQEGSKACLGYTDKIKCHQATLPWILMPHAAALVSKAY